MGTLSFPPNQDERIVTEKPYSQATARLIDEEVRKIIAHAYERTEALLKDKREQVTIVLFSLSLSLSLSVCVCV